MRTLVDLSRLLLASKPSERLSFASECIEEDRTVRAVLLLKYSKDLAITGFGLVRLIPFLIKVAKR